MRGHVCERVVAKSLLSIRMCQNSRHKAQATDVVAQSEVTLLRRSTLIG